MTSLITLKRAVDRWVRALLFWFFYGFGLFTVSMADPRSYPQRLTQAAGQKERIGN